VVPNFEYTLIEALFNASSLFSSLDNSATLDFLSDHLKKETGEQYICIQYKASNGRWIGMTLDHQVSALSMAYVVDANWGIMVIAPLSILKRVCPKCDQSPSIPRSSRDILMPDLPSG
jgi:hypothetical protein